MELGFNFQELDELEHLHREYSRRLLQVLRNWKAKEEGIASVGALMDACRGAGVAGDAKKALENN